MTSILLLAFVVWLYLLFLRGGYWQAGPLIPQDQPQPEKWPAVVAIVPARDEADVVDRAVRSLLGQDYAGEFTVILVDDGSSDVTSDLVRRLSRVSRRSLTVIDGAPPPNGWSGKLWALEQGLRHYQTNFPATDLIWFTDADIYHPAGNLRRLVAHGLAEGHDLISLMVRLESRGSWTWLLIPAFVYFFQQLYPFRWVANPARRTSAAAGGCILVRRSALQNSGGLERIRGALIDDCALARNLKVGHGYRLWLGLSTKTHSLRPYRKLRGVWAMVSRNAFTQLNYSPVYLALAVLGMLVTYLVGPFCVIVALYSGEFAKLALGAAIWLLMSVSFMPTLRIYGEARSAALLMPIVALLYMAMTLDSARRSWWGNGSKWKGRVTATAPDRRPPRLPAND